MYKVAMYNTIKTLLEHGKSLREISRELGMCRKTVSRIQKALLNGDSAPRQQSRSSGLEVFHEQIEHYLASGLSALLIHQKLIQQHGLTLSYSSVARYIGKFKRAECFVPLHSLPGEEAQVDFGYFGEFRRNGRGVKVWVFSMVLSHSRQSYYKVVTSQQVREFLDCHISAFEYC
ncbi:helix-turn-helix domain-containing protein [Sphingobacterium sp.]|uniref:helix-turn-helix domain-containing protein n=1 Tax=Sphingobacterium sp. TaxID=341027 RepID=UPI00289E4797|nr:helix-turn-helix domain-containing protein [Sphingobacterium sp.]